MKYKVRIGLKLAIAVAGYSYLASSAGVSANDITTGINYANKGGTTSTEVQDIIPNIVGVAMWAVGVVSVIVLIFAGIMYATAAGDEAKIKKAKKAIVAAVVGLVFAILAVAIVTFVNTQLK